MLTRLYVDNYRSLVNSELDLGSRSLLLGRNGTGKSTFAEVLVWIQTFLIGGAKADDLFARDTLTRWQNVMRQRFELDIEGPSGAYRYALLLEHRDVAVPEQSRTRVVQESLTLGGKPLFEFREGVVRLFDDNHHAGPEYPFDWGRSGLGTIGPRPDNTKLTWFGRWLLGLTVVNPNPRSMHDLVEKDDFLLWRDASNFAAWYHAVSAGDKRRDHQLHQTLIDVLPGFEALNFEPAGPGRWLLRADFVREGRRLMIRFSELSDGQRALILLYAMVHFLLDAGHTVFLDEPDNYVSLDELQPWLLSATDSVDAGKGQLILISHHPEIFDQWAVSHGLLAERDGCGPVRIRKFVEEADTELTPAETIARGWGQNGGTSEGATKS